MEFQANRTVALVVGLITGMIGASAVFRVATMQPGESAGPILLVAAFYVGIAMILLTSRISVRIDRTTGCAVLAAQYFIWPKEQTYLLTNFTGVQVGSAGFKKNEGSGTRYFVQLVGSENLELPGTSGDLRLIQTQARSVGRYLGLPCEAKPAPTLARARA